MLLPCIAALVGGGLYSDEKNSGRLRMMLARTGRRDVLRSSFCAGFVLGGCGGVLPLLLNLVVAVVRQPHMSFIDGVDHIATNPYFAYYPVIRSDSWLYPLYKASQPLMLVVVFCADIRAFRSVCVPCDRRIGVYRKTICGDTGSFCGVVADLAAARDSADTRPVGRQRIQSGGFPEFQRRCRTIWRMGRCGQRNAVSCSCRGAVWD